MVKFSIGQLVEGEFDDGLSFLGKIVSIETEKSRLTIEFIAGPEDGEYQSIKFDDLWKLKPIDGF